MCRKIGVALVESRCFWTNQQKDVPDMEKKEVKEMTFSEEMCISGVGLTDLRVDGRTAEIEALVVQEDPLRFHILIGVDTNKALGRVSILKSRELHFLCKQASACTIPALFIEPNFDAEFDQ